MSNKTTGAAQLATAAAPLGFGTTDNDSAQGSAQSSGHDTSPAGDAPELAGHPIENPATAASAPLEPEFHAEAHSLFAESRIQLRPEGPELDTISREEPDFNDRLINPDPSTFFGPETLTVPARPDLLRQAAQRTADLCERLSSHAGRLSADDTTSSVNAGGSGATVRSLRGVAEHIGTTLDSDVNRLHRLREALTAAADAATDADGQLNEQRRRWREAREQLRQAFGADTDPTGGAYGFFVREADEDAVSAHEATLTRLTGKPVVLGGIRTMMAYLAPDHVQPAIATYRQQVSAIVEEIVYALQRVHHADQDVADHLTTSGQFIVADNGPAAPAGRSVTSSTTDEPATAQVDTMTISQPQELRAISDRLHGQLAGFEEYSDAIGEIERACAEGRALPEQEREAGTGGFQTWWSQHFDELRDDLRHAADATDDVIERLGEADRQGAISVRRFRAFTAQKA